MIDMREHVLYGGARESIDRCGTYSANDGSYLAGRDWDLATI